MANEMSADDKAELALRLWEFLAMALVEKGVLSMTEATLPLTKAEMEDFENRALKARTLAMLRRMHGLPDEEQGDDLPY